MINKITYYISPSLDPFYNLAIEEYFLENVLEDEIILYLWQNKNTVVIGKNQSAWQECCFDKLAEDKGLVVRRISGGGAVYHDLGNLNFTFIMNKVNYDLKKQVNVIKDAVESFGIEVEVSGRNDLLINGLKFSGNAFCHKKLNSFHHGTILIKSNKESIKKYLNVQSEKLDKHSVQSVKSRVTTLAEHCPNISIDDVKERLIVHFDSSYQGELSKYNDMQIDNNRVNELILKYKDKEFIFGPKTNFNYHVRSQFSFGELNIQFYVCSFTICDIALCTDALDVELFENIKKSLIGLKFDQNLIVNKLNNLMVEDDEIYGGFQYDVVNRKAIISEMSKFIKDYNW